MSSRFAVAVAASIALAACDLSNPDRRVVEVGIASSGKTALFFDDGVAIVDPMLNGARFLPYPERPFLEGDYALSHDGTRGVVGWGAENVMQPDGSITQVGTSEVDVFDMMDGHLVRGFDVPLAEPGLSDDGSRLVANAADPSVSPPVEALTVFNVDDGSPLWSMPGRSRFVVIPTANAIAVLELSQDPMTPAPTLSIRDLDTGVVRLAIPVTQIPADQIAVAELAASPDGSVLGVAVGTEDRVNLTIGSHILLFNGSDGALMRDLVFPDSEPWQLALSSGGRYVAAVFLVTGMADRPSQWDLLMWDGSTLASRTPYDYGTLSNRGIAFSPDGRLLVAAQIWRAGVYSVPSGEELVHRTYKQDLF